MSKELTPAQHEEIKALLLARRNELQGQMLQNRENLAPPAADATGAAYARAAEQGAPQRGLRPPARLA